MFNARQIQLLSALLKYSTVRKAREACDVPERTAYRWLATESFQEAYRERLELLSQAPWEKVVQLSLTELEQSARR